MPQSGRSLPTRTPQRTIPHTPAGVPKPGMPNTASSTSIRMACRMASLLSGPRRGTTKLSIACCVCQGGWMSGYDPQGDLSTEKELGQMTRSDCIFAAKAVAGANAASIDGTATETVKGTCYAEINAHYSAKGWTADSSKQACLFGK